MDKNKLILVIVFLVIVILGILYLVNEDVLFGPTLMAGENEHIFEVGECNGRTLGHYKKENGVCFRCLPSFSQRISYLWLERPCDEAYNWCVDECISDFPNVEDYSDLLICVGLCTDIFDQSQQIYQN